MVPVMGSVTKCHHFISGPGVPRPTGTLAQHADWTHRTRTGNGSQMLSGNGKTFPGSDF